MSKPDYGSRVDVFRRGADAAPQPVPDLQGVTLAHAVRVIMQDWPLRSRKDALIATAKGFLGPREIRETYERSDFPDRRK
jgi:hypothetical protein